MASKPSSLPSPSAEIAEPTAAELPGSGTESGWPAAAAGFFVMVFGLLLASFPARNPELWSHLAAGRALVHGSPDRISPTWLYDVTSYALFQTLGGAGLVAVKAGMVALLGLVLVRLSRAHGGWLIPVVCTVLALLAVGSRAQLAPTTVSYLFLALVIQESGKRTRTDLFWPGWRLVGLFLLWANVDPGFVIGLGTVALIQLGQWLDARGDATAPGGRSLLARLGVMAILAGVTATNPAYWTGFTLPAELGWGTAAEGGDLAGRPAAISPFGRTYLAALGNVPAALAYYPLFGLGLASFLLRPLRHRGERFLPWAGLALVSAFQARAIPFFAVVAGPVLAWNLQDYFARRPRPVLVGRMREAAFPLMILLGVIFLAVAWPGWLQRPPFEPRRWAIPSPAGLEQAAAFVQRGYGERIWPAEVRTLHLSRDTASAFAWFCPEDASVLDPSLATALAEATNPRTDDQLWAAGIGRVVVQIADRGPPRSALVRLLADPERWPLLHLEGGVAVFGRRDPLRPDRRESFRGPELDLDRLGFHPSEREKAPPAPVETPRRWWDAFWKPAPYPTGDREQAAVLLLKAEALRGTAPLRHLATWEASQLAALIGAASGWIAPGEMDEAAVRWTVLHPPVPASGGRLPPITQYVFDCQRLFALARDDAPPGVLYAAVRAARRAVSSNPADARAYLLLGQSYLRLLTATRERVWALRLPQLAQLRQAQASAALNQAIALNPGLAQAHLELGRLYQQVGYVDLALTHLRAYRQAVRSTAGEDGREPVSNAELTQLAADVERQRAAFAPESTRARVVDRARAAVQRGLAGEARKILLESDVSAFGTEGMELELDLLLRSGRPEDVRGWLDAEFKSSLGAVSYHWTRTQALAALGDYAAADAELIALAGEPAPAPSQIADGLALLTGRALLNEQAGGFGLPSVAARVLARWGFLATLQQEITRLTGWANTVVVRGLLALEAGEVEKARAAFQTALTFSADSAAGAGLDFNGQLVAREGLRLLR
jgi:tetratricopeptide (TPR) repeat protein